MENEDKKPTVVDGPTQESPKQFRGVAIHIQPDGKYALEVVGVAILEVFGALSLVLDKLKKDLQI